MTPNETNDPVDGHKVKDAGEETIRESDMVPAAVAPIIPITAPLEDVVRDNQRGGKRRFPKRTKRSKKTGDPTDEKHFFRVMETWEKAGLFDA